MEEDVLPNLQPEFLVESYPLLQDKQPVELFELFYGKNVLKLILVESNRYAAQNSAHNFNFTKEELKIFLAMLNLSGYLTLPRQALYWCRDDDVVVLLIQQKLLQNRFRAIKQYLHLADNITIDKNNRLVKVRQYKNIYKRLFSQFGVFTKNLSIDEEMILYYGRSALKQ